MKNLQRKYKSKEEIQDSLEKRFDYLSREERDRLIYGTEFVKVPSEELKRLRIDSYSYLI